MASLPEILLQKDRRERVVNDCVHLVEDEVSSKSGLTGAAVKGAFVIVKKVKPGVIREAVDRLLDAFVDRLQPFYSEFLASGEPHLDAFFTNRSTEVAHALLEVTDERALKAKNAVIKKAYGKLRPSGLKHVAAAVPGIARVLSVHTAAPPTP